MLSTISTENKIRTFQREKLTIKVFPTLSEMGARAAREVSDRICALLAGKAEVNMIFAAAPSQLEFLHRLTEDERIDWARINAFHMDEYVGIPSEAPQSFANFL
ncbi:MAG: glucosamine-6-phosphate deaminase, partial [Alistipes sp.]|nr:glucosamine-6-phosphate deaminase [Alistipes sp.]